jgi:murein DD-endopeptidase MepM/ murein hydrolase activator NlpD
MMGPVRRSFLSALALLLTAAPAWAQEQLPLDQATQHVVQPGETLSGIANRAKVPRVLIAEANRLEPPYALRAGQKLKIPRTRHHTVIRGETGFTISYNYGVPWRDIAVANALSPGAALRPGQKLLIPTIIAAPRPANVPAASAPTVASDRFGWPVAGPIRRGYTERGRRNHHDGLDITAREGTAVRATAAGTVLFAGPEPRQFGNLVIIDHGEGWHSAYAFLSRITVTKDEAVNKGERIGLVGKTGLAKGPELHFELRQNNGPVDPADQLPEPK